MSIEVFWMAEKNETRLENNIYDKLKERLNRESGSKNKDEKIAELLKLFIEKEIIKVGAELSVTDLASNLNISRNTASGAIKILEAEHIVRSESARPYTIIRKTSVYPSKRGNNISISQWAKENNILLKTKIVSCDPITKKDLIKQTNDKGEEKLINKIWPALGLDSETTQLLEIRRIRKFRGKDDNEFRKGISEVSFINPENCPDMQSDYKIPEFENIGFHDYYSQKNLQLVRSEFNVKAKNLSSFHFAPWLKETRITNKEEFNSFMQEEETINLARKAFLRINCVTYCQFGPVEVSISYFDSEVISLESTQLQPLFINP